MPKKPCSADPPRVGERAVSSSRLLSKLWFGVTKVKQFLEVGKCGCRSFSAATALVMVLVGQNRRIFVVYFLNSGHKKLDVFLVVLKNDFGWG